MVWWDEKWNTSEPTVATHTYENRLQTQSNWGEISDKDIIYYNLQRYPVVSAGWESITILSNGPRYPKADKYLRYLNGLLNTAGGGYKRIRIWVVVFNNQPQMAAEYQMRYWKGGNKNELVLLFGTNPDKEILWFDVMSWSERDVLKIMIRDQVLLSMNSTNSGYSGKLTDEDMLKFAEWLGQAVKDNYIKPDFKKYDYIEVYPSNKAMFISFLIILIVNIGTGVFIIYNPWGD